MQQDEQNTVQKNVSATDHFFWGRAAPWGVKGLLFSWVLVHGVLLSPLLEQPRCWEAWEKRFAVSLNFFFAAPVALGHDLAQGKKASTSCEHTGKTLSAYTPAALPADVREPLDQARCKPPAPGREKTAEALRLLSLPGCSDTCNYSRHTKGLSWHTSCSGAYLAPPSQEPQNLLPGQVALPHQGHDELPAAGGHVL